MVAAGRHHSNATPVAQSVSADFGDGVNGVLFSTRLHLVTSGYVFQDLSSLLLTHEASLFKQDSVAKE